MVFQNDKNFSRQEIGREITLGKGTELVDQKNVELIKRAMSGI